MFRKIFITVIFAMLVVSVASAQSTGRIAGKILDKTTGEPLIGANVLVVGTNFGAATDVNGYYVIANLNPGTYGVKASYVGYQSVTIENVMVVSGLTQEVNFKLPSKTIATKPVVIVAKTPLIQKSATNAIRIITSQDIQSLPVRSITDYISLQPGVIVTGEGVHIRGSRPEETGYVLEGTNVKNPVAGGGGSLISVTPDALAEITLQAGGYTAQYGNANAGIIQEALKTGTSKYHASLRMETDNFGQYPGKKFLGTYSYGYSDYVLTLSGPLFTNNIKLFLSGENNFSRNNARFWYGSPTAYSDGALLDTTHIFDTGARGGSQTDSQILTWPAGNLLGGARSRYTLNGTALLDYKPLLVRVAGAFTYYKNRGPGGLFDMFDLQRLGIGSGNNLLLNLRGTYFLNSNSFFQLTLGYLDNRYRNYDEAFGNNLLAYGDSLANAHAGYPNFRSYFIGPAQYDFYGFPFNRPGAPLSGFAKGDMSDYNASFAFTTQLKRNEIKIGGSYTRYTYRRYGLGTGILQLLMQNPDSLRTTANLRDMIRHYNVTSIGYDEFGAPVSSGINRPRHPALGSFYVQDKIELSDIIINAGLRFDYISMDDWKLTNPLNPGFNRYTFTFNDTSLTNGDTYRYVSPRLGLSFPVTDCFPSTIWKVCTSSKA